MKEITYLEPDVSDNVHLANSQMSLTWEPATINVPLATARRVSHGNQQNDKCTPSKQLDESYMGTSNDKCTPSKQPDESHMGTSNDKCTPSKQPDESYMGTSNDKVT